MTAERREAIGYLKEEHTLSERSGRELVSMARTTATKARDDAKAKN